MEEPVTSLPVMLAVPHCPLLQAKSSQLALHPRALIWERAASHAVVTLTHRGQGLWGSQGEDMPGDPWNQWVVLISSQAEGTGDVTQEILKAGGPPEFVT